MQASEVEESELRCTICGCWYAPVEMKNPDTCLGCAEFHQGISARPAKHKEETPLIRTSKSLLYIRKKR
jgi:hypothetical protein